MVSLYVVLSAALTTGKLSEPVGAVAPHVNRSADDEATILELHVVRCYVAGVTILPGTLNLGIGVGAHEDELVVVAVQDGSGVGRTNVSDLPPPALCAATYMRPRVVFLARVRTDCVGVNSSGAPLPSWPRSDTIESATMDGLSLLPEPDPVKQFHNVSSRRGRVALPRLSRRYSSLRSPSMRNMLSQRRA